MVAAHADSGNSLQSKYRRRQQQFSNFRAKGLVNEITGGAPLIKRGEAVKTTGQLTRGAATGIGQRPTPLSHPISRHEIILRAECVEQIVNHIEPAKLSR